MQENNIRNRITFGLGTIGRDMVYALVSMFLMFYLTDVINLPVSTMWWIAGIILAARVFDAFNDPIMGLIVDNTNSRLGKYKIWITIGAITSPIFTILLFTNFGFQGNAYIISFAVIYLLWGICYTIHDISYWSMLPSLSVNQKEREKIGALSRIFANIGLFFVVVAILPLTTLLEKKLGSMQSGYLVFSICVSVFMAMGMFVTVFGVKETNIVTAKKQSTPLREIIGIIVKNDQLFFTAISLSLFMIGYMTTTSFGLYFFKYAYGDKDMFSIFSAILGVSQLSALAVFQFFSKKFDRKTLYTGAIISMSVGYLLFFFAPVNKMLPIGIAGVLIFFGQSFIQLLMVMFLADSVDYGHWKLGKRNDSITFSLQPLINKLGGAVGSGVVSVVIIVSGIKEADTAADVTPAGILMMKIAMLIFPLLCFAGSYLIYRMKYKIDGKFYEQMLSDLRERGELTKDS
jgi:melibiose permease/lactose/raffinose/galactose permease